MSKTGSSTTVKFFKPETQITTRLLLRPYAITDLDDFVTLNADAEVRRFMDGPLTRAAAIRRFCLNLSSRVPADHICWAVVERKTNDYVGHLFFTNNQELGATEVGFLFLKPYWGRGYATEVLSVMLEYAWHALGLQRVVATVDLEHRASRSLLEKCGFSLESILEDAQGEYCLYSHTAT